MRVYPGWIKTTLKEDKNIIHCLVEAYANSPTDKQRRVLAQVKLNLLDRNNDLMAHLWHQFLATLDELGVERPVVNLNSSYPEKGTYYVISGRGKNGKGKLREEARVKRSQHRTRQWQSAISSAGIDFSEIEVALAEDDSAVGRFRDEVLSEIEGYERENQRLTDRISEIEDEFVSHIESFEALRGEVGRLTELVASLGIAMNGDAIVGVSSDDAGHVAH